MPESQIESAARTFYEAMVAWAVQALPQIIAAILLLIIGFWFAGWLSRQIGKFISREARVDATLHGVLTSVVRYAVLIVVLVAALGQLGVQTTSILAALGAAGLAIGLALQGTLSNIAAGMMLLWLRPYRVGDFIDAGGVSGTVKEVGLFATELHSWDGIYQFVPNSELWNKRLINFNRLPTRLVEVKVGISYGDDIEKAKQVLIDVAKSNDRVRSEPAPIAFVSALGDSAVEMSLRAWVASSDYWPSLRALSEASKTQLEAAGLSIPFPQVDVHFDAPKSDASDMMKVRAAGQTT